MRVARAVVSAVPTFRHAGFFALRTPLLPFMKFEQWAKLNATDSQASITHLMSLKSDPVIMEALYLASPSLHKRLEQNDLKKDDVKTKKLLLALFRYFSRMCTRSTPYGLFAGVSTGAIGAATSLELPRQTMYRRKTRLDNGYVCAIASLLEQDPILRPRLNFFVNNSAYAVGDRLRFVEYSNVGGSRYYQLSEVSDDEAIKFVQARAATGIRLEHLENDIERAFEVGKDEAQEYVAELISSKLLVSELEPAITGEEPFDQLVRRLADKGEGSRLSKEVLEIHALVSHLDECKLGCAIAEYKKLEERLMALQIPIKQESLVQVDLFKPSESLTLEEDLVSRIARCAEAIWHLGPPPAMLLANFVERFRKRYDNQSVRLVDALDEEHGIGFANPGTDESPLLFGLRREPKASAGNVTFGRFESMLTVKLIEALRRGEDEVILSTEDIPPVPLDRLKPPESFSVQLSLEKNGAGNKPQAILRFFPVTAASLFGRFCHGDQKLRQNLVDLAKREEDISGDAVIAEIVHLPRGRIGNVIARPSFSEYEITYLGSSGLPIEKQIRVEDLRLVLEGDELKLFSDRLKRRVIPRLSCAHAFSAKGTLNTYHFLAALQSQNTTMVSSIWPAALRFLPYLPRIRFQDLIISRARWRLDEKDINQIWKISKAERAGALLERLRSLGVPDVCALQQGDNLLTVDLRCELSVENLLSLLTPENSAIFEEALDDSKKSAVFGENESFAHEIIIPFVRQPNVQEVQRAQTWHENTRQKQYALRSFSLGSEWLYAKIYCGTTTADRILCEHLAPLVMQFKSLNELEKWFFIRYGDPDKHLRIRMNGKPQFLIESLLPALHSKLSSLQTEGVISGVQYDTYEREVERYCGPEGIEYCEEIFDADSDAVVAFLNGVGANAYERRVEFVIMGVAQYFDDLGITAEKRIQILINLVSWFGKEHSVDRDYDIRLGNKYRSMSSDLVRWLDCSASLQNSHTKLARIVLSKRSDKIYEAVSTLRRISSERTIESVAPSIIHMFINRVISSAQRNHELVIYDLLRRHYQSQAAQLINAPKEKKYAS